MRFGFVNAIFKRITHLRKQSWRWSRWGSWGIQVRPGWSSPPRIRSWWTWWCCSWTAEAWSSARSREETRCLSYGNSLRGGRSTALHHVSIRWLQCLDRYSIISHHYFIIKKLIFTLRLWNSKDIYLMWRLPRVTVTLNFSQFDWTGPTLCISSSKFVILGLQ